MAGFMLVGKEGVWEVGGGVETANNVHRSLWWVGGWMCVCVCVIFNLCVCVCLYEYV